MEIERLRKHIERSTNQTEKALKDSKRRIEEIERNRAMIITKHAEILKQLKKEHLRELTIEAHANQNNKLEQLRCFLQTTFAQREDDIYIDAILAENRIALFAKLALLIQQIPIVK
uniref:RAB6-interacting golgin n=1 Tax=Ascaris lumbricoides TaxID=6252 RepID=A0A0M3II27_ASCLU